MTAPPGTGDGPSGDAAVELVEGRLASLLSAGALVAVALLVVGLVLMLAAGISPDAATFPVFDPAVVVADLLALRPQGFLWAGILVVIATPVVRVVGEAIGFAATGQRWLAAVAGGILLVIVASVVTALLVGGAAG